MSRDPAFFCIIAHQQASYGCVLFLRADSSQVCRRCVVHSWRCCSDHSALSALCGIWLARSIACLPSAGSARWPQYWLKASIAACLCRLCGAMPCMSCIASTNLLLIAVMMLLPIGSASNSHVYASLNPVAVLGAALATSALAARHALVSCWPIVCLDAIAGAVHPCVHVYCCSFYTLAQTILAGVAPCYGAQSLIVRCLLPQWVVDVNLWHTWCCQMLALPCRTADRRVPRFVVSWLRLMPVDCSCLLWLF